MPITGVKGRKGPLDAVFSYAKEDLWVMRDVLVVVKIEEFRMPHRPIRRKSSKYQAGGNQQDPEHHVKLLLYPVCNRESLSTVRCNGRWRSAAVFGRSDFRRLSARDH